MPRWSSSFFHLGIHIGAHGDKNKLIRFWDQGQDNSMTKFAKNTIFGVFDASIDFHQTSASGGSGVKIKMPAYTIDAVIAPAIISQEPRQCMEDKHEHLSALLSSAQGGCNIDLSYNVECHSKYRMQKKQSTKTQVFVV